MTTQTTLGVIKVAHTVRTRKYIWIFNIFLTEPGQLHARRNCSKFAASDQTLSSPRLHALIWRCRIKTRPRHKSLPILFHLHNFRYF